MSNTGTSRRDVLIGSLATGAAALTPWHAASAQTSAIPREKTLILVWSGSREGRWVDFELWNPYAIGSNHQNGPNLIYEPLAYYSAFADKTYMWLAEIGHVHPRLQAAHHQDPARHQLERRGAVLG